MWAVPRMESTVKDGSAFGAQQPGPASGIATFILYALLRLLTGRDVLCGAGSSALVDVERVDREAHRTDRSDFVLGAEGNRLGHLGSQHDAETATLGRYWRVSTTCLATSRNSDPGPDQAWPRAWPL